MIQFNYFWVNFSGHMQSLQPERGQNWNLTDLPFLQGRSCSRCRYKATDGLRENLLPPLDGLACSGSLEPRPGPWEPGCIWLLHYKPFHWLGCTELMNWSSGQEHIIGRNEFLSQLSHEAASPGWSHARLFLLELRQREKKKHKKRVWDEASACIWFWIKGNRINVQFGLNLKAKAA